MAIYHSKRSTGNKVLFYIYGIFYKINFSQFWSDSKFYSGTLYIPVLRFAEGRHEKVLVSKNLQT